MKSNITIFSVFFLCFCLTDALGKNTQSKNLYIDNTVIALPEMSVPNNSTAFQLISHGRPGELLLNGRWRDAKEIATFLLSQNILSSKVKYLNIYGCEFGKGTKGQKAVAYLEKVLHLRVAASSNITGKNGDWDLEIGQPHNVISCKNYQFDLQYAGDQDLDGDGFVNAVDLDDDNDGILDRVECPQLTNYSTNGFGWPTDALISAIHSTIARGSDGLYYTWGETMSATGTPQLTPIAITPANGFNYTGNIAFVTVGGDNQMADQGVVITDDGKIWAWGLATQCVTSPAPAFQRASLPLAAAGTPTATASASIPSGVSVSDIKYITGYGAAINGRGGILLLTKNGDVYMYTTNSVSGQRGIGGVASGTAANSWTRVQTSAGVFLTNVAEAKATNFAMFVRTSSNTYYTWGNGSALGNGVGASNHTFATLMTAPANVNPMQIAVCASNTNGNYYILDADGTVWVMGLNTTGALGTGVATASNSWTKMKDTAGTDTLTNVRFISANDNGSLGAAASVILSDGTVYSMGNNPQFQIGGLVAGTNYLLPIVPTGTAGVKCFTVENGGHITPIIKANGEIGNVGHNQNGAFGNNVSASSASSTYNGNYVTTTLSTSPPQYEVCDYDNDSIYNYLDLDSDADGCPDSKESSVNTSFPAVQYSNASAINPADTVVEDSSQIALATFVDVKRNGFDDRLETTTQGSYSGTYTYPEAIDSTINSTCSIVLSSSITSFDGQVQKNDKNLLTWTIEDAALAQSFKVMRSRDQKKWNEIGTILSSNVHGRQNFQMTDNMPSGIDFYQLSMIDLNGKTTLYPKIVYLRNGTGLKDWAQIFPNPADNIIHIEYDALANGANLRIEIVSLTGTTLKKMTYKLSSGRNMFNISLNDLANGAYYIRYQNDINGNHDNIRFIKNSN